jgi:hypothetical protein
MIMRESKTYPEHISILQMSLGIPFLGMDEMWELGWIPDEEHGSVIKDPIPVSLVGPELDGKATGIAGGVGGARLTTNGGEADGSADLLAYGAEKLV